MARTPVRPLAPNPADGRSSHASPGRWPRPRTRTAPCSRGISCSCGSRGVRSRPGRVSTVGAMKTRTGGDLDAVVVRDDAFRGRLHVQGPPAPVRGARSSIMRLDADMAVSLSTLAFLHWQGPDGSAGSKAAASVVPRPRYRSCLESRPGVACRRLSHMTRSPM